MVYAMDGKELIILQQLESRKAFCDGFKIAKGPYEGSLDLQRFL